MDVLIHSNMQKKILPHKLAQSAEAQHLHTQKRNSGTIRLQGISDLTATHVRNSECAKITYVHE